MGISLKIRYFVNWMIPPWFPLADAAIIRYSVYNCVYNFRAVSVLQTHYGTFMRMNKGTRCSIIKRKSSVTCQQSFVTYLMFYKWKIFFYQQRNYFLDVVKLKNFSTKDAIIKYQTNPKYYNIYTYWIKKMNIKNVNMKFYSQYIKFR